MNSVYFLKHIGLSPVKIGYSSSPDPSKRIESFKTASPYGIEILGFIVCDDGKALESRLHNKWKERRCNGEWFELSEEEVEREVSLNSDSRLIEKKNQFMLDQMKLDKEEPEPIDGLKSISCEQFVEWWECFKPVSHHKYSKKDLFDNFILEQSHVDWVSQRKFTAWLITAAKLRGLNVSEGKSYYRWILFSTP